MIFKALLSPSINMDRPTSNTRVVFVPRTHAGVRVDHDNAQTYAGFWACVTVISATLAGLPKRVYKHQSHDRKEIQPNNTVDWLIHRQPNPETTAFTFWEVAIRHCLTWGNGYAEIERDIAGRPQWLWLIAPDRVKPDRYKGRLIYEITNPREQNTVIEAADMLHVKGPGFDGMMGYSVVQMAAQSIGLGLATERFGATFFGNGARAGGYLKTPNKLKEPARINLRESFERLHQGPNNAHRLAILEEGMEWANNSIPPDDSQFLQTRQFQVEEVCRWFRMPPHKIQNLLRSTFSNIEAQNIEFATDCIAPWAWRVEHEIDAKLFGPQQRGQYVSKVSLNHLARGDSAARSNYYRTMMNLGVMSINEVRAEEDMNPIGKEGDARFIQINMATIENVISGKAQQKPNPAQGGPKSPQPGEGGAPGGPNGKQPGAKPEPGTGDQPAGEPSAKGGPSGMANRLRAVYGRVIAEAVGRCLRREAGRLTDARKRLAEKPERLAAWLDDFCREHQGYLAETLGLPLEGFADLLLTGQPPSIVAHAVAATLAGYIERHLESLRAMAAAGEVPLEGTEAMAAEGLMDSVCEMYALATCRNGQAEKVEVSQ